MRTNPEINVRVARAIKGCLALQLLTLFLLPFHRGNAQTAWTSVDQSSVLMGQTVNVTVYVDDGQGEGLFEAWANVHDPSGGSNILWSTFINYYYQTPWYTTGGCTPDSAGTWWFDAWGYTGDYPRSGRVISGGYASTYAAPVLPSANSDYISVAQGQNVSYQISASNDPTSYSASNLPNGLSLDSGSGMITGTIPSNGGTSGSDSTVTSTITASNSYGSSSATLTWNITAARISPAASVSPATTYLSQSVTLTRAGTCNFGTAYTYGTIWRPDGGTDSVSASGLGSTSYTPDGGTGTYWFQFRIVDTYNNFADQWISFTITSPSVQAPTSLSATIVGSNFAIISWTGASAQVGIAYYNVYRNGVYVGRTTSPNDPDNTLASGTTYTYQIQTVDAQGNISGLSSVIAITTLADFELFTPLP